MSGTSSSIQLLPLGNAAGADEPSNQSVESFDLSPRTSRERESVADVNNRPTNNPASTLLQPSGSDVPRISLGTYLKQPWKSVCRRLPDGWRFGVTLGAALSFCALVGNLAVFITASVLARHKNGQSSNIAPIRQGNCTEIKKIGLGIHLVINAVSTLLLGASNYCMQCLSAPTRVDINNAHQRGVWLDVGVPSIRNSRFIGWTKIVFWLMLGLSSVPIHLLYNSTFFVSLTNNSYDIYFASEAFTKGGWIDDNVFSGPPSEIEGSWGDLIEKDITRKLSNGSEIHQNIYSYYTTDPYSIQSRVEELGIPTNGSTFERLGNAECIEAYAKILVTDRRNVILIASNSPQDNQYIESVANASNAYAHNQSCEMSYDNNNTNPMFAGEECTCDNLLGAPIRSPELNLVSCAANSSLFTIVSYRNDLEPIRKPLTSNWFYWICSQEGMSSNTSRESTCSDEYWQMIKSNASQSWNVWGYDIEYCISESVQEQCSLNVATGLLAVIALFNAVKFVVITLTLWKVKDKPLITLGDVAASFIREPDATTLGRCLLAKPDLPGLFSRAKRFAPGCRKPKPYASEIRRQAASVSIVQWTLSFFLLPSALAALVTLLCLAVSKLNASYDKGSAKSLFEIGLSTTSPYTVIRGEGWNVPQEGDAAIIDTVLIANIPQVILSFIYFTINGLITRMSLASEWARYAHDRRALRVSEPRGGQRSTYFLQLPYRLGIPLMVFSTFLHWVVSQSIYIVKIDGKDGVGNEMKLSSGTSEVSCGYSPLGMIIAIIALTAFIAFVLSLGARKLQPGMPLAGSCSMIISAACHAPAGTSECLPIMWGAIPGAEVEPEDGQEVGHCAFSNDRVDVPIDGRLYA